MNGREVYWPRGRTLGGSSVDQRPDLHPRPARGLRPLGGARQSGLALRRRAAVFPRARAQRRAARANGTVPMGRCGRSDIDAQARAGRGDHRRRRRARHPAQRRLQRRDAGRRRLLPADDAARLALLDRRRAICSPAAHARTSTSRPTHTRRAMRVRRPARDAASSTARAAATSTVAARSRSDRSRAGALQSPQLLQLSGIGPPARCCNASASASCMRWPASAKTCRTTCRPAMIFRCTQPDHDQRRARVALAQACASACDIVLRRARARWRWASTRAACSRAPMPDVDAARRAVPLRDAVVGHGGLAGAHVPGIHDVGLPAPAGIARLRAHQVAPTRSPRRRCRRTTCRRRRDRATLVAGLRLARRLAATRAMAPLRRRRIPSRRRRRPRTTTCSSSRATPAARSSIRAARPGWGRRPIRWRSSTANCGCTAATRCASSIAASCRRSCRATRTRRR